MVLSASSVNALKAYGSSWVIFERQLMWMALGAVALLVGVRIDYRRWQKLGLPLLAITASLLVLVVIPAWAPTSTARAVGSGWARSRCSPPSWPSSVWSWWSPTCSPGGPTASASRVRSSGPSLLMFGASACS